MADKATNTRTLKTVFKYADDDTRTINVTNPNAYSASDANTVREALNAFGNVTISDKSGAAFVQANTAYIEDTTTTHLDLTY